MKLKLVDVRTESGIVFMIPDAIAKVIGAKDGDTVSAGDSALGSAYMMGYCQAQLDAENDDRKIPVNDKINKQR